MNLAIQLIATAQLLINLVIGNPNLPQQDKARALVQATQAITVAQSELSKVETNQLVVQNNPTEQPLPIKNNEQVFGSTKTMENTLIIDTDSIKSYQEEGLQFGRYVIRAYVVDQNGKRVKDQAITISGDGTETSNPPKPQIRNTSSITGNVGNGNSVYDDYFASFDFTPKKSGINTLTFKLGDITKSIDIDVK